MATLHIAKTCHEVNRAYCEGIGDKTQLPWDSAPQWQRDSVLKGVVFAIANPSVTPEAMHLNWMADKVAAGWKYGPEKNPEAKTHPCMLAYDKLPEPQRVKDALFLAVVRTLSETTGG